MIENDIYRSIQNAEQKIKQDIYERRMGIRIDKKS